MWWGDSHTLYLGSDVGVTASQLSTGAESDGVAADPCAPQPTLIPPATGVKVPQFVPALSLRFFVG